MTRILNLRSAGRAVLRLGSGWKRARPGRGMAEKIGRVIGELESLNRSTERDFLAVGDKLMEFRTSARAISSDMAAVTELIAGEQGRNASAALDQLLAHSHEMDSGIERSEEALCTVRELSARLRKAFAGLPNMVAVVQSLCTLTQIETARLGGAGADLGHLAAEIRPLSESIQASGESVVASSNRLDEAVQRAMRGGAELRATQLKQMPALIASVLAGLQSFEERRRLALESSQRQASEFAAVTEAIDDLVGSIQFHDITRQQLEHVLEALRRLRGVAAGAGGGYSAHEARTILRLQRSQLEEAERLFVESIERMDRSLEAISGRLQNAAEAVQNLTGGAGDGQDFFAKMEAQFASIVKLLGACTAAQREIESTATGLAQTIGGMQTSVASIRGTEIQIQRISTNATIRATHIGASGVALNKIAEVMQRLALESNANTEEVATALDGMTEAVGRIGAREGEAAKDNNAQDSNRIEQALAGLHSSRESSAARVDHVARTSSELAEEIAALRSRLSAGKLFGEVAGRARAQLESLGAEAGEHASDDAGAESTEAGMQHLQHLADSYTMQRQRDVHHSVVGTMQTPARMESQAPGDGELGDNVDLF